MAFRIESTYDGAGTIVETGYMTDSEAGAVGEVMKWASGRLTKCGVDDAPQAVLIKATAAGTDVTTEFVRVRRDQVYIADYTGTDPVIGALYGFDATGLLIDGDNTAGGEVLVVSVDTANDKCRVKFQSE